jgi:hypothetical protein
LVARCQDLLSPELKLVFRSSTPTHLPRSIAVSDAIGRKDRQRHQVCKGARQSVLNHLFEFLGWVASGAKHRIEIKLLCHLATPHFCFRTAANDSRNNSNAKQISKTTTNNLRHSYYPPMNANEAADIYLQHVAAPTIMSVFSPVDAPHPSAKAKQPVDSSTFMDAEFR